MTTVRELWKRVEHRHGPGADDRYCDTCRQKHPCLDYKDAIAALALIDAADIGHDPFLSLAEGRYRLVPDPEAAS